ncbi:MAG: methyltransferase domain-containing protein [Verrucomicrobia bacterium]|nr:methyltransferase domain-containing protein [Verrucomicrobiota bacterium]
MKYSSTQEFIATIRHAPYVPKTEFIRSRVAGKKVLDLGCVQHSLDRLFQAPERWLHNVIRANASSVLGVDILEKEVVQLNGMGYNMIVADATTMRLEEKFDVVVCGDLIEHLPNPGALLETIAYHLRQDGIGLVTTPHPLAADRFFNVAFDGWTGINPEHTCWFCPQTIYQLAERCGMHVDDFCWLETIFKSPTKRWFWGFFCNTISRWLVRRNRMMHLDFGVVLSAKRTADHELLSVPSTR